MESQIANYITEFISATTSICLVVLAIYCARYLSDIKSNIQQFRSEVKAEMAALHNQHENKIIVLQVKQTEFDSILKDHHVKIEKNSDDIIQLKLKRSIK